MILSLKIPLHLRCVATLNCEMSENRSVFDEVKAYMKLRRMKLRRTKSVPVFWATSTLHTASSL